MRKMCVAVILISMIYGCASLSQRLVSQDDSIRKAALIELSQLDDNSKREIVPPLVQALNDEDPGVRSEAIKALGNIGPEAKDAIPVLMEVLNDKYLIVRCSAVRALGKIGPASVPALIQALENEDVQVRFNAVDALVAAGGSAPALIQALKNEHARVRLKAVNALGKIGPAATPPLVQALNDEDPGVRSEAIKALGNIGPEAKDAVPDLVATALNDELEIRSKAIEALGNIGPEAKDAVPALVVALSDKPEIRSKAIEALGNIGPEAKDAVPDLIQALSGKPEIRSKAIEALNKIGSVAVPALVEALNYENSWVRPKVAEILGMIGTLDAQKAVERYRQEEEERARKKAARLEPDLIEAATIYITTLATYDKMKYDLEYKTLSKDLDSKSRELEKYIQKTLYPIRRRFDNLASQYVKEHGPMAFRDLSIQYGFSHLIR